MSVNIVEEAKKGKIVIIASKSNIGKFEVKNRVDAEKVIVVCVD